MARSQWTEVEARGVLEALRRSGLPLERFARERGIVPQRIYWWRHRLAAIEKRNALSTPAAVLSVRVTDEPSRRGEPVTVLLRTGHMLKVSHGFDEDDVACVVALLEGG